MTTYLTQTPQSTIDQWPLQEHDIRAAHPHTSFPSPMLPKDVADMGYLRVHPVDRPEYDADTHMLTELSPVLDVESSQWLQTWSVQAIAGADVAESLAQLQSSTKRSIDSDVDHITLTVVGQRAQEYVEAELQALSYIDAGYTGAVPDYVSSDAQAYSNTAQWSADRIAATASAWRSAQLAMRTQRLMHKASVDACTTHAQVRTVQGEWANAVSIIKTNLGI